MTTPKLYQFEPMLGPPEDWPSGSIEWAERMSNRLQLQASTVNTETGFYLKETVEKINSVEPRPWKIWPKDKPFGTQTDYFKAITGHSWETLEGLIKDFGDTGKLKVEKVRAELARDQVQWRKQGMNRNRDNITVLRGENDNKGGGTASEYLLRRLAREHPNILGAYERGEFKSVRQAAIAAGIVKVPTPLEQLRKDWKKASPEERQTFLSEII